MENGCLVQLSYFHIAVLLKIPLFWKGGIDNLLVGTGKIRLFKGCLILF